MAKKSKDLFQLLQKRRSKGSFKIKPDPDPKAPLDPIGQIASWFRTLLGGSPGGARRPKKKRTAGVGGILISGPTLAGVAFGSLVVGFLLGQGLGASGPEELLAPGARWTINVYRNDQKSGTIRAAIGDNRVTLNFETRDREGKWRPRRQDVGLTYTTPRFGGQRPWFLCPACERRCAGAVDVGRTLQVSRPCAVVACFVRKAVKVP